MKLLHHPETLFSAFPADLCTAPAVLQFFGVAFTFLSACVADYRARVTQQRRVFPAHAHQHRIGTTDDGTLPRKCNATRQHFNVIFFQTLRCTMLTLGSALIARIDTIAEDVVTEYSCMHGISFEVKQRVPAKRHIAFKTFHMRTWIYGNKNYT